MPEARGPLQADLDFHVHGDSDGGGQPYSHRHPHRESHTHWYCRARCDCHEYLGALTHRNELPYGDSRRRYLDARGGGVYTDYRPEPVPDGTFTVADTLAHIRPDGYTYYWQFRDPSLYGGRVPPLHRRWGELDPCARPGPRRGVPTVSPHAGEQQPAGGGPDPGGWRPGI